MQNKLAIRKKYRDLRANLDETVRQQAAVSAANILKEHPLFKHSNKIACYFAHKKEFETGPIIETVWQADKSCYLPVLTEAKSLHFIQYNRHDELKPNQHQIPEPTNRHHVIQPEKLNLVIMPLVAFDKRGNRIGTGGGYYDRTFAFLFEKPRRHLYLLGLAYDFQECENIESEPWDIRLDGILTESGLKEIT